MGSVGVRTAAGGVLSLPTTPANVIGRCDHCRRTYREGDWYCDHLAAQFGHPIAWLTDQEGDAALQPIEPAAAPAAYGRPPGFAIAFASPAS